MGEERKVNKVLARNPEGKRPLGRPRRRWNDGIRMDLREIGWGVWIGLDRLRIGIGGGLLSLRLLTVDIHLTLYPINYYISIVLSSTLSVSIYRLYPLSHLYYPTNQRLFHPHNS
jgi:hypothetical protein